MTVTAALLVLAGSPFALAQAQRAPLSQPVAKPAAASTADDDTAADAPATLPDGPIPGKISRYAHRVIARRDRNGDGKLAKDEWSTMSGDPRRVDLDGDGVITHEELARYVVQFGRRRSIRLIPPSAEQLDWFPSLTGPAEGEQLPKTADQDGTVGGPRQAAAGPAQKSERGVPTPGRFYVPSTRLPQGLPDWFLARDADGDGQISLAEFSSSAKATETEIRSFRSYDADADGLITADECLRATPSVSKDAQDAKPAQEKQAP